MDQGHPPRARLIASSKRVANAVLMALASFSLVVLLWWCGSNWISVARHSLEWHRLAGSTPLGTPVEMLALRTKQVPIVCRTSAELADAATRLLRNPGAAVPPIAGPVFVYHHYDDNTVYLLYFDRDDRLAKVISARHYRG